jgi:hypothetical protein
VNRPADGAGNLDRTRGHGPDIADEDCPESTKGQQNNGRCHRRPQRRPAATTRRQVGHEHGPGQDGLEFGEQTAWNLRFRDRPQKRPILAHPLNQGYGLRLGGQAPADALGVFWIERVLDQRQQLRFIESLGHT